MSEKQPAKTPSMERGEIDAGRTGEKVAGFDPAAAPMETDSEAGGFTTKPAAAYIGGGKPSDHNATASGTAMRDNSGKADHRRFRSWAIGIGVAAVAIMIAMLITTGWM